MRKLTAALAVALANTGLLSVELGTASAASLVPAFLGMALGQRLRHRLPERHFRRTFSGALLILGGYIMAKAFA